MKVLLVNGSPHARGCTFMALSLVAESLNQAGIETEVFQVGTKPLVGCTACRKCTELGKCVFEDRVNEFLAVADGYDGFVFGSPVHFAAATGAMTSFMDRAFYAGSRAGKQPFRLKPGAVVVSARRAGTTATFDQLNKYITYSQMPVISSRYWNMVHGATPEQVLQDEEGVQIMRILGRNMAYVLKCLEAGRQAGLSLPAEEPTTFTNFIR